jgi:hypothetical protein
MRREEIMTKEKPILFSTEMVKAILDGRKSMTRRIVKVANPDEWESANDCRNSEYGATVPCYISRKVATEERGIYYPRYDVDDVLWVRETWADNIPGCPNGITYRADHIDPKGDGPANPIKWKPSIHMPKPAARIWLTVTDVRVERVQGILCGDMKREGCIPDTVVGGQYQQWQRDYWIPLWDSVNKKCGYGWDANPWVWVYEFKRTEAQ